VLFFLFYFVYYLGKNIKCTLLRRGKANWFIIITTPAKAQWQNDEGGTWQMVQIFSSLARVNKIDIFYNNNNNVVY